MKSVTAAFYITCIYYQYILYIYLSSLLWPDSEIEYNPHK